MVSTERQQPRMAVFSDQIVWARSPVRIDIAGGWTDTPPYCLAEGDLGHGLARFLKIYLIRLGFLDGKAGFVLAVNSFFYAFQKYIRLTELNMNATSRQHSKTERPSPS